LIAIDSLPSYETYRTRLKSDAEARENFAMAQTNVLFSRREKFRGSCGWNIRPSLDAGGRGLIDPSLTQAEKGRGFARCMSVTARSLFPIRGMWGTARLLAHLGFEALATTSPAMLSRRQSDNTKTGMR